MVETVDKLRAADAVVTALVNSLREAHSELRSVAELLDRNGLTQGATVVRDRADSCRTALTKAYHWRSLSDKPVRAALKQD